MLVFKIGILRNIFKGDVYFQINVKDNILLNYWNAFIKYHLHKHFIWSNEDKPFGIKQFLKIYIFLKKNKIVPKYLHI